MFDNHKPLMQIIISLSAVFCLATQTTWAQPLELSLSESIALALKNNPAIQIAEADKQKATWILEEAKTGKRPTLNYTHEASHFKEPPSTVPTGVKDDFVNEITLSLPLYTGGKVEGNIKQADLNLTITDLAVEKSRQQIRLDATTGYYNILKASNMVKANQESVDSLSQHLKNVQEHFNVGTVAKSDVLRSEVELANAQQNLIIVQNSYNLAISTLNNIIGLPLDTDLKIREELTYETYSRSLDEDLSYALIHRPEIAQSTANIDSAHVGIRIADSGKLPTITFSGVTDWNDSKFPGTDNHNWSLTLTASWNIYDSGLTHTRVKQAYADLSKIKQQYKQIRDNIQLEVRQSYLNMQEAEKRISTSSVTVTKADEDFKIAQMRYSSGVGTNLDVLDAQVALTQAKTNFIQALYDYNMAKATLDKAIGALEK